MFEYLDNEMYCGEIPLSKIADKYGTPCFVYSRKKFLSSMDGYKNAFPGALVCYALKSNSNPHLIQIAAGKGLGADVVSGGELILALQNGIPPGKICFAGVGKTVDEMKLALNEGIHLFNVESISELRTLNKVAEELGKKAPVAIRVNPNVNLRTHEYIATGKKETKFGVDIDESIDVFKQAYNLPYVNLKGVHIHVGSQLLECSPFIDGVKSVLSLIDILADDGIEIKTLDIGGGLGIAYQPGDVPPSAEELAGKINPHLGGRDIELIIEPGRSISGGCGVLLTKILYIKKSKTKTFYIVDGSMTEMIRPSLYQAYHEILPVVNKAGETITVDIVGPVCESGDFLAKVRKIHGNLDEGDYLAVMSAGAYGYTMASNYNARPRPPEILISGNDDMLIREKEPLDFLLRK